MPMNREDRFINLLCKWTAGKRLDHDEKVALGSRLDRYRQLLDAGIRTSRLPDPAQEQEETSASWQRFKSKYGVSTDLDKDIPVGTPATYRRLWLPAAKAAAVLLLVLGAYFIFRHEQPAHQTAVPLAGKDDIAPGGNNAVLTLADGKTIGLTDASTGTLATQDGTTIRQETKGALRYEAGHGAAHAYTNELTTPRGGRYTVTLPDGSLVKLNAESKLRFPSVFTGADRTVELSGEAWFEVAKKQQPFRVKLGNGLVAEVLGTDFNVNAYAGEPQGKVTLLTGRIRLNTANTNGPVMVPGEQALVSAQGRVEKTFQADDIALREETAWKNDSLYFENASLKAIMNTLERWYDMNVVYADPLESKMIHLAPVTRNVPLSYVLNRLEAARILRYRIEGKKVTLSQWK